eukprot:Opistho-2@59965
MAAIAFDEVGYTVLQYLENAIAICRGSIQGEAIEEVTSAVCLYQVFFEARDPAVPESFVVDILGTRQQLMTGVERIVDAAKTCFDVDEHEPDRDSSEFVKAAVYLVRLTVTTLLRHLTQTRALRCAKCAGTIDDDAIFCDREHSDGNSAWFHRKCVGLVTCPLEDGVSWRCDTCERIAKGGAAPRRKSSADGQIKVADIQRLTKLANASIPSTAEEEDEEGLNGSGTDSHKSEDEGESATAERALRAVAEQLEAEIEIETQRNNTLSKQIMTCKRDEERAIKVQLKESDAKIESLKKRITKLGVAVPVKDERTVEKHQADIERLTDIISKHPLATLGVPNMAHRAFQSARAFFFLKASHWNFEHAEKKLIEHLQWREKHRPDAQTEVAMAAELQSRKFYAYKGDKYGNRCVIFKMNRHVADGDHQRTLRHWLWLGDHVISRSPNPYQKLVLIYDRRLCTRKNIDARLVGKLVKIFNKNYPGRLARVYLLNADRTFRVGFALVKSFLTKEQRDTVAILSQKEDKWQRHLVHDFGAENLQVEFGGTDPFVYDYTFSGEGKEAERVQLLCGIPKSFTPGNRTPTDGSPVSIKRTSSTSADPGSADGRRVSNTGSPSTQTRSVSVSVSVSAESPATSPAGERRDAALSLSRRTSALSVSDATYRRLSADKRELFSEYVIRRNDSKKVRRTSLLAALQDGLVRLESSGDAQSHRSNGLLSRDASISNH